MYAMCAEASADRSGLLWHVLAKDPRRGTLCGRRTPQPHLAAEGAADHYCAACMASFRSEVQEREERAGRE